MRKNAIYINPFENNFVERGPKFRLKKTGGLLFLIRIPYNRYHVIFLNDEYECTYYLIGDSTSLGGGFCTQVFLAKRIDSETYKIKNRFKFNTNF